jgi:hypothetical protein
VREIGKKIVTQAKQTVNGIGQMVLAGIGLSAGSKAFDAMMGTSANVNGEHNITDDDFMNETMMNDYMARQDRDYYSEAEIAKWKAENNITFKITAAFPKPIGETWDAYHSRIGNMRAMERELLDAKYDDLEKEQRKRDDTLTVAQELWHAKWEKQETDLWDKEKMLRQREYEVERMEANAKAAAEKIMRDKDNEIWENNRRESKKLDNFNVKENFEVQEIPSFNSNTDRVGMSRYRNRNDQMSEKRERDLLNEIETEWEKNENEKNVMNEYNEIAKSSADVSTLLLFSSCAELITSFVILCICVKIVCCVQHYQFM